MTGNSKRMTRADQVLKHLRGQPKPLTAEQILENRRSDGVTAVTTIYRALDQLVASGRVHRIEPMNAFTARSGSSHTQTPAFEICEACGACRTEMHPA